MSSNSGYKRNIFKPRPSYTSGTGTGTKSGRSLGKNVFAIILTVLFLTIIAMIIIYMLSECSQKKSFYRYLTDMRPMETCLPRDPSVDDVGDDESIVEKALDNKEVFHISDQQYSLDNAKCKCASYSGELANMSQLTTAYNQNADWMSYGWSKNGAYYPMQKCTWDKRKREGKWVPKSPGIVGGNFPPSAKFGINCYGVKPQGSVVKLKDSECKTKPFCLRDENKRYSKKSEFDTIAPFNNDQWNQ